MKARAIQHLAPRTVAIATVTLPALAPGHLLIRTRYSAISAGTEALIYRGRFPTDLPRDSSLAALQGGFVYPFTYGYALVGEVIDAGAGVDERWYGRTVFAFHPHQTYAVVPASEAMVLPPTIDPRAALFLPSMESALNFVMDANPNYGSKVMVFGQGVVGLLTTALLARHPLALLVSADPAQGRRERSLSMGARKSIDPADTGQWLSLSRELFSQPEAAGLDVAIELSGNMQALNQAIELTGFDGRIIVGSWYGTDARPLDLGGHFHRRRIQLVSSQVSSVNPGLSGRWSKERRIALAWDAIAQLAPQHLITHSFAFHECEHAFQRIGSPADDVLQVIFEYDEQGE